MLQDLNEWAINSAGICCNARCIHCRITSLLGGRILPDGVLKRAIHHPRQILGSNFRFKELVDALVEWLQCGSEATGNDSVTFNRDFSFVYQIIEPATH